MRPVAFGRLFAVACAVGVWSCAAGQTAAQTGRELDASLQVGSGGINQPTPFLQPFNSQLYAGPSKADVGEDEPGRLPVTFVLMAYPSPAVSHMTVRLGVPSSNSGEYRVDVFDVRGRHIRNLVDGQLDAGFR